MRSAPQSSFEQRAESFPKASAASSRPQRYRLLTARVTNGRPRSEKAANSSASPASGGQQRRLAHGLCGHNRSGLPRLRSQGSSRRLCPEAPMGGLALTQGPLQKRTIRSNHTFDRGSRVASQNCGHEAARGSQPVDPENGFTSKKIHVDADQ